MTREEQKKVLKDKGFAYCVGEDSVYFKRFSIFDGIYVWLTIHLATAGKIEADISVCYDEEEIFLENTDDLDIPFDGDVNICIDKARERIIAELQNIMRIVESNLRGAENGDGNRQQG